MTYTYLFCNVNKKNVHHDLDDSYFFLIIFFFLGMFMCAFCKTTGQWNNFLTLSTRTPKIKNKTSEVLEDGTTNMKRLNESLSDIRKNTKELKSLSDDVFHEVLRKICLPVSSF